MKETRTTRNSSECFDRSKYLGLLAPQPGFFSRRCRSKPLPRDHILISSIQNPHHTHCDPPLADDLMSVNSSTSHLLCSFVRHPSWWALIGSSSSGTLELDDASTRCRSCSFAAVPLTWKSSSRNLAGAFSLSRTCRWTCLGVLTVMPLLNDHHFDRDHEGQLLWWLLWDRSWDFLTGDYGGRLQWLLWDKSWDPCKRTMWKEFRS